jgi:hypothetical protein
MCNGIYVDPRITFTRAGTRTYYGQEVVKAEENLLSNSNDFTNATYWTLTNVTGAAVADPNGGTTATRVTAAASNTAHFVDSRNADNNRVGYVIGTRYVMFARAKKGTHDFIQIVQAGGTGVHANFDISTGVVGTSLNTVSTSITESPAGSGWYTCVAITDSIFSIATGGFSVGLVASASATRREAFNAAGTETVDIFQSQIEQRSFATAYTATTTQPITRYQRLLKTAAANEWPREFDPVTGECLGRSVWESRTNLLLRSEEFSDAYWTKSAGGTGLAPVVTPNATIAPDGTLSADLVVFNCADISSASNRSILSRGVTVINGAAYSGTIFIKAATLADVGKTIRFNLENISTDAPKNYVLTDSFQRVVLRQGVSSSTSVTYLIEARGTFTEQQVSVIIWGAQLEAGAFATPYIPTVASQVTRLADSAVMTGVNFSSWYRQDEGAFFAEASHIGTTGFPTVVTASLGAASAAEQIVLYTTTTGITGESFFVRAGNVVQANINGGAVVASGVYFKTSGSYKVNDFATSLNGAAVVTDTSGILPVNDRLTIGALNTSTLYLNGYIKRLTYYNQALTSANLQAITR